jgi:DNA-binding PadR family transcriptional regulator
LSAETRLQAIPSLGETIVLQIINANQPVTGYQIRKKFIQTTNNGLSFGTLVPMLHRFEKYQLVVRVRERQNQPSSYNWLLTPVGIAELQSRLALMARMLKYFGEHHSSGTYPYTGLDSSNAQSEFLDFHFAVSRENKQTTDFQEL